MSRYWSDLVHGLTPYVPGEQPQQERLIKLNTNESPYPPAPGVEQVLRDFDTTKLRLYPDPESVALRAALAAREGLTLDQVFVGNGSDEVLAHAFQGLLKQDAPLLFPDISYSFYPVWCELYDVAFCTVPLDEQFGVDLAGLATGACGGVIVPNPNAPTGRAMSLDEVRALIESRPDVVVVIDEAYVDFGAQSATTLVDAYDNLLVIQTFSKSRSLAGLRVGAAFGQAHLIEALNRVKNSFNSYPLDALAQAAGLAAVEDEAYFLECRDRVVASRERLGYALRELDFEVLPSAANFVFARHVERDAGELFEALRSRGIIVRYFNKPRIEQFLRISIGTDEECDALLAALRELLRSA